MAKLDESAEVEAMIDKGDGSGTDSRTAVKYITEDEMDEAPCFFICPKKHQGVPYKPMKGDAPVPVPTVFRPKNAGLDADGNKQFTWKDDKICDVAYCCCAHTMLYCKFPFCLGVSSDSEQCGQHSVTSCLRTSQRVRRLYCAVHR
eukprot:COSAG01_NODE_9544_length_2414_cov_1.990497_2_plen_146_part_00